MKSAVFFLPFLTVWFSLTGCENNPPPANAALWGPAAGFGVQSNEGQNVAFHHGYAAGPGWGMGPGRGRGMGLDMGPGFGWGSPHHFRAGYGRGAGFRGCVHGCMNGFAGPETPYGRGMGGGFGYGGPLQESLASCEKKKEGDACSFSLGSTLVESTCSAHPRLEGKLVCHGPKVTTTLSPAPGSASASAPAPSAR